MILFLLRCLLETLVHVTAAFVGAVLSHETVQEAGCRVMVRAMNDFLRQPDLNEHVRCMSETMSKNQEDYARSAGQDFPKLAGQFLQGMLSPHRKELPNHNSDNATRQQQQPSSTLAIQNTPPNNSKTLGPLQPLHNLLLQHINNHNKNTQQQQQQPSPPQTPPVDVVKVDPKRMVEKESSSHDDNTSTTTATSSGSTRGSSPTRSTGQGLVTPASPPTTTGNVAIVEEQPKASSSSDDRRPAPRKRHSFLNLPPLGGLSLKGSGGGGSDGGGSPRQRSGSGS